MRHNTKGYLMLTEGRSGSNWLGSLANSTGVMGTLEEWVDPFHLGIELEKLERDQFLGLIWEKASTENGRFAIKLFPRHVHKIQYLYGFDFIAETMRHHGASLILLQRQDRLRQAISFAKAYMTGQWRSYHQAKGEATYDFDLICRCYFYIERSYGYWRSYLGLRDIGYHSFIYETLIDDPTPYISQLCDLLDVKINAQPQTHLDVQRDKRTEEWLERFQCDLATNNVIAPSLLYKRPGRNLRNLRRFLQARRMIPYPMEFSGKE